MPLVWIAEQEGQAIPDSIQEQRRLRIAAIEKINDWYVEDPSDQETAGNATSSEDDQTAKEEKTVNTSAAQRSAIISVPNKE